MALCGIQTVKNMDNDSGRSFKVESGCLRGNVALSGSSTSLILYLAISCHLMQGRLPRWLKGKESPCNAGDVGSMPGSGRSSGEGNGTPRQYSCLINPMDGGAWPTAAHRVRHDGATEHKDRYKDISSHLDQESSLKSGHSENATWWSRFGKCNRSLNLWSSLLDSFFCGVCFFHLSIFILSAGLCVFATWW